VGGLFKVRAGIVGAGAARSRNFVGGLFKVRAGADTPVLLVRDFARRVDPGAVLRGMGRG